MPVKNISFLNGRKEVLRRFKFTSLPISEQVIINKSIEFFCDPEPCFIHRSAVLKRLLAEIEDYFNSMALSGSSEINCSAFTERFGDMINFGEGVESLKFDV
ncbi:MAG: hypothetical protein K0R50_961 [Eubacterium sp.]|nr:hypothetical protein [Eubacterium sp.]